MKSMKNKLNAEKTKAVGAMKETAGKIMGNPKLQAEGNRDRVKGNVQNAVEDVKEAVKQVLKKPM